MLTRLSLAGAAATAVVLPVVLVGALLGVASAAPGSTSGAPSRHARTDIPGDYLAWYAHWSRECPALSWSVVAAIGKVESDHGRTRHPGVRSGSNWAGAAGPMQIGTGGKAGDTWSAYGRDGDVPPDGAADVHHPPDAIRAAVSYLCAHGAGDPTQLRRAIFAYNHSRAYVDHVLTIADGYRAAHPAADTAALLTSPNVTLTENAEADLRAGSIDPRVVTVLTVIAERFPIQISVLQSGHSRYVAGTRRESHHWHGRAVDLAAINGQPVSAGNPAAREVVAWLASLTGSLRPDEVGSPFPEFQDVSGHFHDQAHQQHLHIGFRQFR